jgi:hypothetical protein
MLMLASEPKTMAALSFKRRMTMAYGDDRIEGGTDLQDKVLGLLEEAGFAQDVNDRIVVMIADEEKRIHVERNRSERAADMALSEVLENLHLVWPEDEERNSNPFIRAYMAAAYSLWIRAKLMEGPLFDTYEDLSIRFGSHEVRKSAPYDALANVAALLVDEWDADTDLAENYVVKAFMTAYEVLADGQYLEDGTYLQRR